MPEVSADSSQFKLNRVHLRKTTLVDYPGKVAAALFFPGCNLRCPWCHNRELVNREAENLVPLEAALSHLEKRRKLLGGVVLSGGEPLLFPGLGELIPLIKGLGLKVKLDTNGTLPQLLEKLLENEKTRPD
jgi:pyruvate formate lyase activating enzyme